MSRPLITFVVFGYNQERFIREAIGGALAQTYEPLEIILSDDCSTDGTYEIMQEMAAAYTGPHRVVLNRNEPNGGLALHINRVTQLATGEVFVSAAGDDVSLPHRTWELYRAWVNAGRTSTCIYSDFDLINLESRLICSAPCHVDYSMLTLEQFLKRPAALVCSYAFTRDLAVEFPPLSVEVRNEDFIFPFRALLRGNRLVYVDRPLVRYRIGAGHGSGETFTKRQDWLPALTRERVMLAQLKRDLESQNPVDQVAFAKLSVLLQQNKWKSVLIEEASFYRVATVLLRRLLSNPTDGLEIIRTFLRLRHPSFAELLRRGKRSYQAGAVTVKNLTKSRQGAFNE